jgi:hypothetical protein
MEHNQILVTLAVLAVFRAVEALVVKFMFLRTMRTMSFNPDESQGLIQYVGGDTNLTIAERAIKRIQSLGAENSGIELRKDKAYLGKNTEHGPVFEDVDVAFFLGVELPISHEDHEEVAKAYKNEQFRKQNEEKKQILSVL